MAAKLKHIDSGCIEVIKDSLLDDEQTDIIMSLFHQFNTFNAANIQCKRTLTDSDIADAIRKIMCDHLFMKKSKGHMYALYRVLTNPLAPYIYVTKFTDFHKWLNMVLDTDVSYFSRSIFSIYESTPLRYPIEQWKEKVRAKNLQSFIYVSEAFQKILNGEY